MIISKELKDKLVQSAAELGVGGNESINHNWLHAALIQLDVMENNSASEDFAYDLFPGYEEAICIEVGESHFLCESCNWWFEHYEASDDEEGSCKDCD